MKNRLYEMLSPIAKQAREAKRRQSVWDTYNDPCDHNKNVIISQFITIALQQIKTY